MANQCAGCRDVVGVTRGLQFGFARIAQEGALEAKIRDKENREHPHVTILRGTKAWRINLRTGEFMDDDPNPAEVPRQLVAFIKQQATWQRLRQEWDRMYPNNPVSSDEEEAMVAKAPAKRKQAQMFLLDRAKKRASNFASLRPRVVSSLADLRNCVTHATRDSLWVSYASDLTDALVRSASTVQPTLGMGLFIHSLDMRTLPALASHFRRIAFTADGGFIPAEELAEVLEAKNRSDLFIGGSVDEATETITFWRGDLEALTVPFSAFENSGDGTQPDFNNFSVIDCGQTVRLGPYEAAVDAILYENDPEFRRRVCKRRLQEDQSFGASLRRLRKQRGLRREDFEPDLSAKTIARIEQGKVKRIHPKTLDVLAKRLSIRPEELESY